MKDSQLNVDVIISDGGSSDGSTDTKALQALNVNTLLVKKEAGKLGSQMRIAFSWALEKGYKGVVVIDGNNKDSVENINDFVITSNDLVENIEHINIDDKRINVLTKNQKTKE
jgi:dolichol-phosphate mannosyltransferase